MYLTHPKSFRCLVSLYRVIDAGRDFWTSVVQPLLFKAVQLDWLLQPMSSLVLNISKGRDPTTSVSNLF